jgi:transposase
MAQSVITAGIDVSKPFLDVALYPTRQTIRVDRSAAGLAELAAWLVQHEVHRVGLEATGGYERMVMDRLAAAGFEVIRLNPLFVRRFAQAKGRMAKNDRADARTIAQFTAVMLDHPKPGRRTDLDTLAEHLTLRRQLNDWATDCGNQLEHLNDKTLRKQVQVLRASFERRKAAIEAKLARMIAERDDWASLEQRLRSVPGVGPVLAQTLIALLPELGQIPRRAIAGLVGVAPYDNDSGAHTGERHIKGGRRAIRDVLYMAAVVARQHNPIIAAFARRLVGKPTKVILVACMRKLLSILNALIRDGSDWRAPQTG